MVGYLADLMLGRLTTYLRMTGYDVEYAGDLNLDSDDDVLDYLDETGRTLLTRDRELSRRADDAVLLESLDIEAQLRELAESGFDLRLTTPERCSRCNGRLEKDADAGPPNVGRAWRCRDCGHVYWRGSHWDDVRETLESVRRSSEGA